MNLLLASNAGAQEYRVKGGTQQISENLLKEIGEENVLFDHPVLTINQVKMTVHCFQTLKRIRMFHSKKHQRTPIHHIHFFLFSSNSTDPRNIILICFNKRRRISGLKKTNFFYLFFFHRNRTRLRSCAPTAAALPATGSS